MAEVLWTPGSQRVAEARLTQFMAFARERHAGLTIDDYASLHAWSLGAPEAFWAAVGDFCGLLASDRGDDVLVDGDRWPGARWFPSARLNFAENLLRCRDNRPAIVALREDGWRRELSFAQLYDEVARLAARLRADGVGPGDRVAGFLPNCPETVIAMLATTSIGAIWSSCSPDFGVDGVLERFGQIRPRVLVAADGYIYGGRTFDSLPRLADIVSRLSSLERVIVLPFVSEQPPIGGIPHGVLYAEYADGAAGGIDFEQLPFNHPVYVMFSSGTTGAPKCIVHGAGGTLLQHLKEQQLHVDLKPDDVLFYVTTCGWMMWNWLVSGLATGATIVLYDGSPMAREARVLLDAIDREGITIFGTSPRYLAGLEQAGIRPRESHGLDSLKTLLSTGSPLSCQRFEYVYRDVKSDLCLSSISGGTDLLGCFVGGCPILPVRSGEIQCIQLGMAVEFWSESGQRVAPGEQGELVCTRPFPSCPVAFWNDPDGSRFRAAYFERFPGVWAHGDHGELTADGGVIIHGRSDAILNPAGVRIGTAEIYSRIDDIEEVLDSVVIGQNWQDDVRIVLFVVLREDRKLDEALSEKIRRRLRERASPRHVPAKIIQVSDIPRTISGKIAELAVRDAVHGRDVKNIDALANPAALDQYRELSELNT